MLGLASSGGTSPLRNECWYHSQKDHSAKGRQLESRGRGEGEESPALERQAAWTCQLCDGDSLEHVSATFEKG